MILTQVGGSAAGVRPSVTANPYSSQLRPSASDGGFQSATKSVAAIPGGGGVSCLRTGSARCSRPVSPISLRWSIGPGKQEPRLQRGGCPSVCRVGLRAALPKGNPARSGGPEGRCFSSERSACVPGARPLASDPLGPRRHDPEHVAGDNGPYARYTPCLPFLTRAKSVRVSSSRRRVSVTMPIWAVVSK